MEVTYARRVLGGVFYFLYGGTYARRVLVECCIAYVDVEGTLDVYLENVLSPMWMWKVCSSFTWRMLYCLCGCGNYAGRVLGECCIAYVDVEGTLDLYLESVLFPMYIGRENVIMRSSRINRPNDDFFL